MARPQQMRIFIPFRSYGDPGFKPAARRCAARNAARRCNDAMTDCCTLQRRDDASWKRQRTAVVAAAEGLEQGYSAYGAGPPHRAVPTGGQRQPVDLPVSARHCDGENKKNVTGTQANTHKQRTDETDPRATRSWRRGEPHPTNKQTNTQTAWDARGRERIHL